MDEKRSTFRGDVKKYKKIPKLNIPQIILRVAIVLICGMFCYIFIGRNIPTALIGLGIGISVVGIELALGKIRLDFLVVVIIGGILGFILSKLIDYVILFIEHEALSGFVFRHSLLIKICFVYLGIMVSLKKYSELELLDKEIISKGRKEPKQDIKILDSSVIIDGRILDICSSKFLSGMFILPRFVLNEIHALADSEEHLKRARGKRGLDILSQLQSLTNVTVRIFDKDYPHIRGVDNKLVQMAKEYNAKLLTTDYNLNKIASFQGVTVLNINDLSNALKVVYLPGESFKVEIVKEGKEINQGVGYLPDGTMVIVEGGKKFIGKTIDVVVLSTLQTSSGRIIFTEPKI